MIKKIVKINNTGKFRSYASKGEIQFNKMNLIYSENGRGKTTLSNILRSLHDQNNDLILGRKTLGSNEEQSIDILTDKGMIKFKGNVWSEKPTFDIEIFDSHFVNQNVFSGYIVEHDQKKKMYLFTIGKKGVEFVDQLVHVDEELKVANNLKKQLEKDIVSGIHSVITCSEFISLKPMDNLDIEISKQKMILKGIEKETEIKETPTLNLINLPPFDKKRFLSNFERTILKHLMHDAEVLTKEHIHNRLDTSKGEKWLEYGVKQITNDACPFCDQDISQINIVKAFQSFFSQEYNGAKEIIANLESSFNQIFSSEKIFALQNAVSANIELSNYWKQYIPFDKKPNFNLEFSQTTWRAFTEEITSLIKAKKSAPLEEITIPESLTIQISNYLSLLDEIQTYNNEINEINVQIEQKKKSIDTINIQNTKTKLNYLLNIELRYLEDKVTIIKKYQEHLDILRSLEERKKQIKLDLNAYTETIFTKYEERINFHLNKCGASFTITGYKSSFLGGKPSSNFALTINGCKVDLGNEKSPISRPSFSNTLSEGDKSCLAFAFFLAKLETDSDVQSKVVIFDDPISSLDNHRKNYTADQILRFSNLAKQVLVLTHDSYFARILWQKFADKSSLLTQLCIRRDGITDSKIDIWNIEEETKNDYYQGYFVLADFLEGNSKLDLRAVARCIRPLIEGNLRIRFPKDFKNDEWLGNFIDKVRNGASPAVIQMQPQLSELEEINDFSKKYHHDKNPFADSETLNETELQSYVERTLNVIRGVHTISA
ncbi:AAA family ATPase [Paenibacillus sp. 453mf]|uniref:AAA family ATPase n=1 Tax=Paenibacillus sp. 453mf TaxID=1761874 RepID=UPI0008EDDF40|nr:AAA family ATPase [Paenibacillus sp. 453mf]SFS59636.1 Wobble nucleotide-excising tRNase [Paenibacillus sp. 453mf]